eukprot:gb/GFBE01002000.1/.p1 GENE.gb/GFBE01002000.1/~~gb/GFBE01002000.1/.p1  ORF type:complete len:449 (+),score=115.04 gb/GFBE01002000.1/:1-1347(+)
MAGVLAQLPGGELQFVPVAPQILLGCVSEVAHRLRRVLSPALGFERPRCEQSPAAEEEDAACCCLPESEEESPEEVEEDCKLPAEDDEEEYRLLFQGRDLEDESVAASFLKVFESGRPCMVRVLFRLLGGKGGFGALLRSQKGGKKTTNFDAMRDLNGRRIRHVKAVERIKGWLEKKKRDDELVALLTGEGPELPKPTPESESLDPEFVRKLKRAAESRPSVVNQGLRHLLAEAGSSSGSTEGDAAKRARTDDSAAADDGVDWLGALEALGELSSPSGEEDEEAEKEAASSSAPAAAAASSASSSSSSAKPAASSQAAAKPVAAAAKAASSRVSEPASSEAKPAASASGAKVAPPAAAAPKPAAPKAQPAPPEKVELIKPEDLRKYSSVEELVKKASAESLKQSLQALGLKCGGRPEDRAKRLFELKDKSLKDLPKSFFAPPPKSQDD